MFAIDLLMLSSTWYKSREKREGRQVQREELTTKKDQTEAEPTLLYYAPVTFSNSVFSGEVCLGFLPRFFCGVVAVSGYLTRNSANSTSSF
jgi:hypothetical protein